MQSRKYTKKNFRTELQKKAKTTSKVLEKPVVLSYEELSLSYPYGVRFSIAPHTKEDLKLFGA
jgi:hypothetical protein